MSAPSAAIRSPCSIAFSTEKKFPASENESGVTFNTPMVKPFRETVKTRSPILQILSRITSETNATARLFEMLSLRSAKRGQNRMHSTVADCGCSYFFRE
jgi:hypothetical protein